MSAIILDGKALSVQKAVELSARVVSLAQHGIIPGLAVVLVGDNPASKVYVKNKKLACAKIGVYSEQHDLPTTATQQELLALIDSLNENPKIHGILVQLPLPAHLNEKEVIAAISPAKDVDAFHLENIGGVMRGDARFKPCTPAGVMELLKSADIAVEGKECVVIGRSNIVGKPMAMLLLEANGTVTVCHSKTANLAETCRRADILVCAIGKAKFVGTEMVKLGAVVIDVGMNRDETGKLCGDVDYDAVAGVAGYITPVPGGVGPMTISMLMNNTVCAAESLLPQ